MMKRRSMILIVVVLLVCIALAGCNRIVEKEELRVIGIVTSVDYRDSYITFSVISNGKTTITVPRNHPAKYLVTIAYGDIEEVFNNKELFDRVDVGDSVQVTLVNGYTADHELVKQYLQY